MKRLDQGRLHPQLEHPETIMSRPGIELGPPAQASTIAKRYSNAVTIRNLYNTLFYEQKSLDPNFSIKPV